MSAGARRTIPAARELRAAARIACWSRGVPIAVRLAIGTAAAAVAVLGAAPVAAAPPEPSPPTIRRADVARIDRLLTLIQARLERAPEFAAVRWRAMSRIEDPAAERQLLDAARRQAGGLRLDAQSAASFAQAQIDAGKIIQAERHKQWALAPAAAPPREKVANALHATTSEPELDASLLRAWRDAIPVLKKRDARAIVDARAADLIHVGGPDLLAAQTALAPLYQIANQNPNGNAK